ncbi:MAG: hypothetical protein AB7N24_22290 [Dehalococcoidia bacterium]
MGQQQQPEEKGWTPIEDARAAANLLTLAMQTMAAPMEVILRKRFGRRAFGVPSALALLVIPMWMVFWPEEDPRPMWWFWMLFVVMQLRARIESVVLATRGPRVHSRYNGDSRLQWLGRWLDPKNIKGGVEGFLVTFGGFAMMEWSKPLGSYMVVAGISVIGVMTLIESVDRRRTEQLHDAWLEQQYQAERFREMREKFRS